MYSPLNARSPLAYMVVDNIVHRLFQGTWFRLKLILQCAKPTATATATTTRTATRTATHTTLSTHNTTFARSSGRSPLVPRRPPCHCSRAPCRRHSSGPRPGARRGRGELGLGLGLGLELGLGNRTPAAPDFEKKSVLGKHTIIHFNILMIVKFNTYYIPRLF